MFIVENSIRSKTYFVSDVKLFWKGIHKVLTLHTAVKVPSIKSQQFMCCDLVVYT